MKVCIKNFNGKIKQWKNRKPFRINTSLNLMSKVNERIKRFKCFPSNILTRMFLFEIFVRMLSKLSSYCTFFLQFAMNIGNIKSFQPNYTPVQIKYCFHKNLYNGSRLLFTNYIWKVIFVRFT